MNFGALITFGRDYFQRRYPYVCRAAQSQFRSLALSCGLRVDVFDPNVRMDRRDARESTCCVLIVTASWRRYRTFGLRGAFIALPCREQYSRNPAKSGGVNSLNIASMVGAVCALPSAVAA